MRQWMKINWLTNSQEVLPLKFMACNLLRNLYFSKWQAVWPNKLKTILESEARLISLYLEIQVLPNPNSLNIFHTSHQEPSIQLVKVVLVLVWQLLLLVTLLRKSFLWRLVRWCLLIWGFVVLMSLIRCKKMTELQSMKSWNNKQFQSPRQVLSQH